MNELVERVARALSLEVKRQWNGQVVIKELNDPTSWSAEGGSLDLTELAKAAIRALPGDWVSVGERLPELKEGDVLVSRYIPGRQTEIAMPGADGFWYTPEAKKLTDVTHWMPLPAPPTETGK